MICTYLDFSRATLDDRTTAKIKCELANRQILVISWQIFGQCYPGASQYAKVFKHIQDRAEMSPMFEFFSFLLPTYPGQPKHSPSALMELHQTWWNYFCLTLHRINLSIQNLPLLSLGMKFTEKGNGILATK